LKYRKIPALSGIELINLLEKDGWEIKRQAKHGVSLIKRVGVRTKVAVIPNKSSSLPEDTLHRILSLKQTGMRKKGLLELLNK